MPRFREMGRTLSLLCLCALALASSVVGTACNKARSPEAPAATAEAEIPALTIDEVATGIEQKTLTVIDNNTESRYRKSHVPTAKWVAFNDVKASDLPADKAQRLVFYCANEH